MTQLYNDDLLFIHIPKCGGTSIGGQRDSASGELSQGWLTQQIPDMLPRDLPIGHMPLCLMERHTGRHPSSFKQVIAVIRDPYAQQVSQWSFWRKRFKAGSRHPNDVFANKSLFKDFVGTDRALGRWLAGGKVDMWEAAGDSPREVGGYYRWWLQVDGRIPINVRVFKLEELNPLRELVALYTCQMTPQVPQKLQSEHRDPQEYYDDDLRDVVEHAFPWAFATHYPKYTPEL